MSRRKSTVVATVAILMVGLVLGFLVATSLNLTHQSTATVNRPQESRRRLGGSDSLPAAGWDLQNTSKAFVAIAKAVVPTVVSIHATKIVTTAGMERFRDEDQLREFFGDRFFRFHTPREFRQRGSGSGIILTSEGYIVTNAHVVEEAQRIRVTLSDERSFEARLIGVDPLTEVAVIKIEAQNLPVARFGNSDEAEVGEWVLAIGNPLELKSTLTHGIISYKGRDINIISDSYGVENFIQTDAAISPGNSGGALVNLKGEVIGMTTAIATETGYNQGYGFAIPISLVNAVTRDLIADGKVVRGYLGISMRDVDETIAKGLGLKEPEGVFIDDVLADGPTRRAGIRPKDVLLQVDGVKVSRANQVQSLIAQKDPGETVLLTVLRAGKSLSIPVTLGERQVQTVRPQAEGPPRKFRDLGLEVEEVDSKPGLGLSDSEKGGVRVTNLERFSPAEEAGIRIEDIVVQIGDQPVRSVADFKRAVSRLRGDQVVIFDIRRDEMRFHAFVEVPKE